jgi:hypothetical protein
MIGLPEWETADESRLAKMWSIEDKRHVAPAVCNGRAARSFPASFSQQHLHRHPLASQNPKLSTHVATISTKLFWNFKRSCRIETTRRLVPSRHVCITSKGHLHLPMLVPP